MVRVAGLHDQVDAGIETRRARTGAAPARRSRAIRSAIVREQTRRQASRPGARAAAGARRARHPDRRPRRRRLRDERAASTSASGARSSPCSRRSRSASGGRSRTSRTCRCRSGRRARPGDRARDVRAREGAEGDAAALRPGRRRAHVRAARGPDRRHLDTLFPGMEIVDYDVFRVTRDADFTVADEADDLLSAVEDELRRRRFGEVVRLEVGAGMSRRACASAPCEALGDRGGRRLRGRRAARPQGPVGCSSASRLRRAARSAVDPASRSRGSSPTRARSPT